MDLQPAHFAGFFRAIHGFNPFPWQQDLVNKLANDGTWPEVLDLPTGSGKTAALDAAVFHLALGSDVPGTAAIRIAFVVDRRLVVDDALVRAQRIQQALDRAPSKPSPGEVVVAEVARRLRQLAGKDAPPLVVQRLRGGVPLENDWARAPTQPTILCSTVDQVGSRLLFRGYGVSDRMKPVHAGLLGTDSLILLDEAHLAEPFRQTLEAVCRLGRANVRMALLSATPGKQKAKPFALRDGDRAHPMLKRRLEATKPVALKKVRGETKSVTEKFASEVRLMANRLRELRTSPTAIGVVVNRVALARSIFNALDGDPETKAVLMIGRSRGVCREEIAKFLSPYRTGEEQMRAEARPLVVVATQCLEVGVDLDLDGLVVQAASLDALRQRFGRLNRGGRTEVSEGTIIALAEDIAGRADDPVYGDRIRLTWKALCEIANDGVVDFGVETLPKLLADANFDTECLESVRPSAPVLMPAYLDLWSQTFPRPMADPDVGLFLHGAQRTAAGVSIVWRTDITERDMERAAESYLKEIFQLVPPRASEAVEVPLWVARKWLHHETSSVDTDASDVPEREPEFAVVRRPKKSRLAFRWGGRTNPDTRVVEASELRIGDLLVVPGKYGGCDRFGWAPEDTSCVADVADDAARPYWGRRCAVRIARDIVRSQENWDRIIDVLAVEGIGGNELVEKLIAALPSEVVDDGICDPIPRGVLESLKALRHAKGPVEVRRISYSGRRNGGAILVSGRGVVNASENDDAGTPTTEDDLTSSTSSKPVYIDDHGCRVARFVTSYSKTLRLDSCSANDLALAARLHDVGKADLRFQTMLAGGDPWNRPDGQPLAKSGRSWSPHARERAGLPRGWRHEALSVSMARVHPEFATAHDPALVLWLIGTHHGFGRPFFNFLDAAPAQPASCMGVENWGLSPDERRPQSLAFDFAGFDWPSLFEKLKQYYGIWGLAYLEAIFRLSDHRASEEEQSS